MGSLSNIFLRIYKYESIYLYFYAIYNKLLDSFFPSSFSIHLDHPSFTLRIFFKLLL
ncbi:hypothetical protein BDA99DRAFT_514292 [Phascolomyces articulosus]|uniref:Uncharacterized protein n=1 Tax=Phascolomyces articulosus TaxID=60185 RepID=A0AAD5PE63_9FUNG|nr:hypothetical protein BDA99DRAFT_514292 [Phascolomyces articulosus]